MAQATFAFDYCVQRVSAAEKQGLDLRHVQNVSIGAEPIHAQTLQAFCDTFAPAGFRPEVLHPAYGLAEMTLLTTIHTMPGQSATLLRRHDERTIVGCGMPVSRTTLRIVDPQTRLRCNDGESGEIWLAGPSVAAGYWNAPEATRETFQAYLADTHEGPFLRTGDLGFLHDGELFISGRLKNMLIVHGQNYYGEEIEKSIKHTHPRLNHQTTAVFGVDGPADELIVVAQEFDRQTADVDDVTSAIRRAVSDDFGLAVHTIVFTKRGGLPRTTSGKLQRAECRAMYLDGTLPSFARWSLDAQPVVVDTKAGNDIQSTLIDMWQHVLARPVVPDDDYFQLGGTSLDILRLISDVEYRFGTRIPDTFFAQPTLRNMVRLVQENMPAAAVSSFEPIPLHVPDERASERLPRRSTKQLMVDMRRSISRKIGARIPLVLVNKLRAAPRSVRLLVLMEYGILNLPYKYGRRVLQWWVKQGIVQTLLYKRERHIINTFVAHVHGGVVAPGTLQHILMSTIMSDYCMARASVEQVDGAPADALRGPFWKPFRQSIAALARHENAASITLKHRAIFDNVEPDRGIILVIYHTPWLRLLQLTLTSAFERPMSVVRRESINAISRMTFTGTHAHTSRTYDPRALAIHLRSAQEFLRKGSVVVIAADGAIGKGRQMLLPFGARWFPFHMGFAELAVRTNSVVIPVRATMTHDGRFEISFDAPFDHGDVQRPHIEKVEGLVQQYATFFEHALREDPASMRVRTMKHVLKRSKAKVDDDVSVS